MSTVDLPIRFRHYATRFYHYVLFFGGFSKPDSSALHSWHEICLYDTITDKIEVCPVEGPEEKSPIWTCCGFAVNTGSDIYTFGGQVMVPGRFSDIKKNAEFNNALWKLSHKEIKTERSEEKKYTFEWSELKIDNKQMPAPRAYFGAWKYGGCVWIFGGVSHSKDFVERSKYLNEYGDVFDVEDDPEMDGLVLNNQLFCYDPENGDNGKWENTMWSGDFPLPRADMSTARVDDHVLMYGGLVHYGCRSGSLYQLDMRTRHWSMIETGEPYPKLIRFHTLNRLSDNVILLYGGFQKDVPWIFNISNKKWKKLDIEQYRGRIAHTATTMGNTVIIIGGDDEYDQTVTNIEIVKL